MPSPYEDPYRDHPFDCGIWAYGGGRCDCNYEELKKYRETYRARVALTEAKHAGGVGNLPAGRRRTTMDYLNQPVKEGHISSDLTPLLKGKGTHMNPDIQAFAERMKERLLSSPGTAKDTHYLRGRLSLEALNMMTVTYNIPPAHTCLQTACAERKAERKEDAITSAATHLLRALTPTGMNDRKSMQYISTHLIPAALKNYKALHPTARLEPITVEDAVHIASVTRLTAQEVYDLGKSH